MKVLAASVALLAAYESTLAIARFQRRKRVFDAAQARALGRPLVVVGADAPESKRLEIEANLPGIVGLVDEPGFLLK